VRDLIIKLVSLSQNVRKGLRVSKQDTSQFQVLVTLVKNLQQDLERHALDLTKIQLDHTQHVKKISNASILACLPNQVQRKLAV
jgi:hypothetical protein